MSGYYLLDNPSRIPQHRTVRRNGAAPSGVVVLHTAENATDFEGVDSGAEAVARFIATRSDPGSYHVLVDSDSTIRLAPWSAECWHDTRTNNHSVGISAAVRSADWSRLGARGERAVVRMALAAREYAAWLHATRGVVIPARRITRAQALDRVPGFIGHGEIDTGRRTDPGPDFPWSLFLAVYAAPELAASHGVIGGNVPTVPAPAAPVPLKPAPADPFGEDPTMYERAIIAAYRKHLGRTPGAAEVDDRILRIAADDKPAERLKAEINGIAGSNEARNRPVVLLYQKHLGRTASPAEAGHWLNVTGGDLAKVEAGIKASEEYRRRQAATKA